MTEHKQAERRLEQAIKAADEARAEELQALAQLYPEGTEGVALLRRDQIHPSPCRVVDHEARGHLRVRLTQTTGRDPVYKTVHYLKFRPN